MDVSRASRRPRRASTGSACRRGPSAAIVALGSLAALWLLSCAGPTAGPNRGAPNAEGPLERSADYWERYSDWKIAHQNLLRGLDGPVVELMAVKESLRTAQKSLGALRSDVYPDQLEEFDRLVAEYESVHNQIAAGIPRREVVTHLRNLGAAVRSRFQPDAERSAPL